MWKCVACTHVPLASLVISLWWVFLCLHLQFWGFSRNWTGIVKKYDTYQVCWTICNHSSPPPPFKEWHLGSYVWHVSQHVFGVRKTLTSAAETAGVGNHAPEVIYALLNSSIRSKLEETSLIVGKSDSFFYIYPSFFLFFAPWGGSQKNTPSNFLNSLFLSRLFV